MTDEKRTMSMRTMVVTWGVAAVAVIASPSALAKSEKPMSGKALAETVCARCHDVAKRTIPDRRIGDGSPPSFVQIAQDPKMTPEVLYQFLRFPHGAMNYLFVTQREADSLIDYIQSLKPPAVPTGRPH
jgi:mono/diheme cytochrome c family protein